MSQMSGTSSSGEAQHINTAAVVSQAQGLSDLAASGGIPNTQLTAATHLNSLEALKKLSPQLYNQLIQSIGQNMIIDFRRREEHLEQEMKKNRERG